MSLSQHRQITLGFAVVAAGLLTIGGVLFRVQEELRDSQEWVGHTHRVEAALARVALRGKDTESAARGYVDETDPALRAKFLLSERKRDEAIGVLQKLTLDNPFQQRHLGAIEEGIRARSAFLDQAVALAAAGKSAEGKALLHSADATRTRSELVQTFQEMQAEEDRLLLQRQERWDASASRTEHFCEALLLLTATLIAATFAGLRREAIRRERAELDVSRAAAQLRQANEDLAAARDQALHASQAKGRFLADMSHEIRTPLNGVVGMASLLVESELSPKDRQSVETIRSSAEMLLRVVNDILDLSKIEAERMELVATPTDLGQLMRDTVTLYQGRAQESGTTLELEMPETRLPTVLVDGVRFKQVVGNLVGNAVKFTRNGKVVVRLETFPRKGAEAPFRIVVEDTGPGISPDQLESIFESFTQGRSTKEDRQVGTGLGLPIARRLAELMGGRLWVESKLGQGSRFYVEMSLQAVLAPAPAAERGQLFLGSGCRVLLAEDSEVNVIVAQRLLETIGCTVDVASNGDEAIRMALENSYDLVLMDMRMPICDGPDATRAIREAEAAARRRTPIVAVTANAFAEDRQTCLEAGMDDFLSKPFTVAALRDLVGKWCGEV